MSALFEWRESIRGAPTPMRGEGWPERSEPYALPSTARLVAYALSFYMDTDTLENARPGPTRLARETALSLSTVKMALTTLQSQGYLKQTSKGGTDSGGSARRPSVYRGLVRGEIRTRPGTRPVREMDGRTRPANGQDPSGRRAGPVREMDTTSSPISTEISVACERCEGAGIYRLAGHEFSCTHLEATG